MQVFRDTNMPPAARRFDFHIDFNNTNGYLVSHQNKEVCMHCKICHHKSEKKFEAVILNKYSTSYFACPVCGFVQTGEPVWLEEAYKEAINSCDTGILSRNIRLRDSVATILYYFFDQNASYLDYAGGYGIFTRLMRDVGFDFYWCDKYSKNIVAQGFEYDNNSPINLVTAFEVMEHLVDPLVDLKKMLSISRNIFFTTALIPEPLPAPHEWWYYGVEHGQHISFYTRTTLEKIAQSFGLHYSAFEDLHLMTEKSISPLKLSLLRKCLKKFHLFERVQKKMKSRSMADMYHVLSLNPTP